MTLLRGELMNSEGNEFRPLCLCETIGFITGSGSPQTKYALAVSLNGGHSISGDSNGSCSQRLFYLELAISSTISWAAARGSGAARMGRPTTMKSAPARIASRGVAVRV